LEKPVAGLEQEQIGSSGDWTVSSGCARDGLPTGWWGHRIRIDAGAIHTIVVNKAERRALALYDDKPASYTLQHCVDDLIMPRLLACDGHLVLHGSLVATRLGVIGFIGESGKGKSTLSASLSLRGMPLLTDDAFRLQKTDERWLGERLYPGLRLFPNVIDHLYPDGIASQPVAEYTSKRRLTCPATRGGGEIAALFRLGESVSNVRSVRLAPAQACMALIANAFALDLDDAAESRARFARASEASLAIPIYDLHYPRAFERLPCVHDAILATLGL
jgi:hypothetical protein